MKCWLALVCLTTLLMGCGYGDFQRQDAYVQSKWNDVLQQYQRRADLIPRAVATVKGQPNFEHSALARLIDARSKAAFIPATPELLNHPAAFTQFQQAQVELSEAVDHLFTIAERYPHLQSNPAFQDIRNMLTDADQRISATHHAYLLAAQDYNALARSFPSNITGLFLGYKTKPKFNAKNEAAATAIAKTTFPH